MEGLPPKIRAFIALRMDPAVDETICAFIDRIRNLGAEVSWTKPANLHLTLMFLGGAVAAERIAHVADALGPIAAATPVFAVTTRAVGAFPNLHKPRVIWARLESPELADLAGRVQDAAANLGFEPEKRKYSPHLTIGRVRSMRNFGPTRRELESASELTFGTSHITSVAIYRSLLSPKGATYELLKAFTFRD
jgi:2'-5' RNA ligase